MVKKLRTCNDQMKSINLSVEDSTEEVTRIINKNKTVEEY